MSKIIATLLCLPASLILAEEPSSPWEHTAAAGFGYTSGNSDSLSCNLQFLGTYRDEDREAYYGLDYFFSEYDGTTSNNSLRLFGAFNRRIGEKFYVGLNSSLYTNEVSLVDYRVDISPVFGYYFKRDKKRLLSVEIGPGYAFESKDGLSDSFATMRLAQHFDYQWNDYTRIRQHASLTPKADDPASYIFEFSAGLDMRIGKSWDIQPRVIHRVDLTPAFGQEKADTLLTFGLAYSLNGFLKEETDRADERKTLKRKDLRKEGNRQGWVRNAAVAASSSSGNSDTLNFHLNYETIFRSPHHDLSFKGDYRYGEASGETKDNRLSLATSYSWKFDKAVYAGTGINFAYDDAVDLNYRITPGVHAGKYVLLTDYGGLALEAGLGYTFQKEGGIISNKPSFNVAERLYWQLGYHTYITQEIAYQAFVDDPSDFNISSYLYLDTFLTEDLSWRVGLQYYYDNTPSIGKENDDLSLISGIAVRF